MRTLARWGLLGIGFLLVGGIAYRAGRGSFGLAPAGAQGPAGWKTHEDPIGFSVSVPPGWSVRGDRASGRAELQSATGESVVVWPVFLASSAGGRPGASLDPASASAVARRLAGKLWPDAQWDAAQPAGPAAVRLSGNHGDRALVSVLAWISSPKGAAAYFYATAAPRARYRSLEDTFAKVLASFRVVGAPTQQPSEAAVRYVRW